MSCPPPYIHLFTNKLYLKLSKNLRDLKYKERVARHKRNKEVRGSVHSGRGSIFPNLNEDCNYDSNHSFDSEDVTIKANKYLINQSYTIKKPEVSRPKWQNMTGKVVINLAPSQLTGDDNIDQDLEFSSDRDSHSYCVDSPCGRYCKFIKPNEQKKIIIQSINASNNNYLPNVNSFTLQI